MARSSSPPDQGVPPGKDTPGQDTKSVATSPSRKNSSEEPDMALEPDLPSDGRDEEGDAMIRDLPQRPELSEPPSQPDTSSNNS